MKRRGKMMNRISRASVVLAWLVAPALAQAQATPVNLPGAEGAVATDRYQRDRAAYEAGLRATAAATARAAEERRAYEARMATYRTRRIGAPRGEPAVAAEVLAAGIDAVGTRGILVEGKKQRTCRTVGGRIPTGSLVARSKARIVCTGDKGAAAEMARSAYETDRDTRALVEPHAADIYTPER